MGLSSLHPVLALLIAMGVTSLGALGARAEMRLARIFDDHMVLQRGEPVAVFGSDQSGQAVRVAFAGQEKETTAGADGRWRVDLDPLVASMTGREMTVTGSSAVTLRDVVVGEVWLAAGQSNMNWQVRQSASKPEPERYALIRMANWESQVGVSARQVYGPGEFAKLGPENHYAGTWEQLDAKSVLPQSGVAYFFANALARESKGRMPIGIVDISRGGTTTEAFIAPEVLRRNPYLAAAFEDPRQARTLGQWATSRIRKNLGGYTHTDPDLPHPHPFAPGFLHSAALPHIVPFTFKGVIWYQGESNAEFTTDGFRWNGERLADYQSMVMKTLIDSWRGEFGKPDLPFYMVQLPRIKASNRVLWPWFREAQARVARDHDGVEIAVVTEFGVDGSNVHPSAKKPVGERLAKIALAKAYGRPGAYTGPSYSRCQVNGRSIVIHFDHLGGGLVDQDGGALRNFAIAGRDRRFVPALARISGDTVVVSSDTVPEPVAVRHGWHMNADVDLFNKAGLSAPPFRTDDWRVAPGRPIRVACIGDSITFGARLKDRANDAYPVRLAGLLGEGYEVRSFGKSGFGIHRPAKKYDQTKEFRNALAFEPDIVICNLGINDITQWGTYKRDDMVSEYRKLIDAFASLSTHPYILQWHELAPLFPGQKFHGDPNVDILNDWVGYSAAHTGVDTIDMFVPLKDHPEWFPDHIHPDKDGSRAIAEEIARFLQEIDGIGANRTNKAGGPVGTSPLRPHRNSVDVHALRLSGSIEVPEPGLTLRRAVIPILTDGEPHPFLELDLVLAEPRVLTAASFSFAGTGIIGSINGLQLQAGDARFATTARCEPVTTLKGRLPLAAGRHRIALTGAVRKGTDPLGTISLTCQDLVFADGTRITPHPSDLPPLRLAYPIHKRGQFDCHTFRIPAIARANDGSLLAVYDLRYNSRRDLQEHMDIGLSRSTDGGRTWADPVPIMDMGEFGGKPQKENGCSDPGILVDTRTGEIFVSAVWTHGKPGTHQWSGKGSEPGHDIHKSSQFMVVRSNDHGVSWSEPENWTKDLKDPAWHLFAPAPGNGITLSDGTLVMPTQGRDAKGHPFSNLTWSKDHGKTWTVSAPARSNTTECAVAELSNGSLLLNMRDNRNRSDKSETNGRAMGVTRDLGKSWQIHPADHGALPEPVCMASMISHTLADGRHVLIFSNPRNKKGRRDMTIQLSFDDGRTWPANHHLLLDQKGGAYSSLVMVDNQTIGILYESSQADMVFQKIALGDLIQ